jgi:hypothetical protein
VVNIQLVGKLQTQPGLSCFEGVLEGIMGCRMCGQDTWFIARVFGLYKQSKPVFYDPQHRLI